MFKYLLYFLLAWFAYNLIFRFIIPVYRTSKQMKRQFSQMQENMQQHMNQQNPQQGNNPFQQKPSQPAKPKASSGGDYIDFEEIK